MLILAGRVELGNLRPGPRWCWVAWFSPGATLLVFGAVLISLTMLPWLVLIVLDVHLQPNGSQRYWAYAGPYLSRRLSSASGLDSLISGGEVDVRAVGLLLASQARPNGDVGRQSQ